MIQAEMLTAFVPHLRFAVLHNLHFAGAFLG